MWSRYKYIKELNDILRESLSKYSNVHINSPKNSIPNTLNISLVDRSSKEVVKELSKKGIYLSTNTACSLEDSISKSVLALTNDENLASNTIRISISHLTTKKDINKFLKELESIIK